MTPRVFLPSFLSIITFLLVVGYVFAHQTDEERTIRIYDTGFNPVNLIIPVGTTVVFENSGQNDHWPASNIHPTHDIYPEFDPKKPIASKESWEFTFNQTGDWLFHDHLDPALTGSIKVTGPETDNGPKQQKKLDVPLLTRIKFGLLDVYFYFFPEDKRTYASWQSISNLVNAKNEAKLTYLISLVGPEQIVKQLFEQSGSGEYFNCHVFAHTVGRLTYNSLGENAIHKNITLCHSGYQHGVMAAFINATGTRDLVKRLDNICEEADSNFGKLTCYHGVGHGLMAYYGNDLPTAVDRCLTLGDRFKQSNCLVGTFMENIGSRVGDSVSDHPTVWLKDDDLHYPCNAIDQSQQVQNMCYSIQPDWMNRFYKNDILKVMQECMKAPEKSRSSCFFGVGQETAFFATRSDYKKIAELCSQVPDQSDYQDRCFNAAELIILDFWGPNITNQGEEYCKAVPERFLENCKKVLNDRLKDLKKI